MNVKRLKDLREDKDKSQSDIAKILKITQHNTLCMKLVLD